ncbi:hypothetical protein N4G70_20200 [Streptomyces sp. ASQP_92]|uniref:hypothetical protein n=1 Tax=Streptomyces sp. ASQP_92 TaxID=2979116 RepID=UPI0021C1D8EF|nr:hypothetical protein [Streptomyces sp. ASQP_92]MCT9091165.1 hypothetical protein [Streptomyces sp. ASQP_92]
MNDHDEPTTEQRTAERPTTVEPALGEAATESPEPTPRRRRRLVPFVAGAVALLVVAGGAVWALGKLGDADRTAPTVLQATPSGAATPTPRAAAPVRAGLGGKLLPLPWDYELGPDIGEFGNDAVFGAQQAVAMLKDGGRHLPADEREKNDKAIDGLKVQGVALRSYTKDGVVTEMRLSQMENTKAIKELNAFQGEFAHALKALRAGPKIAGHANAVCFLLPKDDTVKLDAMFCNAFEGDVMVGTYTYGPAPLDTDAAAKLLGRQLDLIKSPGESV